MIRTPSTLLNLALSDSIDGGFEPGRIANIIGDSSSGKTVLALGTLAEACYDPAFDEYRLIYDDVEAALGFDLSRLFGDRFVERLETPPGVEFSETIEQFYVNVLQLLDDGKPFIYVLDSFDALSSDEDEKLAAELVKTGKIGGSYGTAKAKMASQILRKINGALKETRSLLIIISQTRDNLEFGFQKKTRSGGRALNFYSSYEMWLSHKGKIKTSNIVVGNLVHAQITKNKVTGKLRDVEFPIYYEIGIDDVGSMVDWLVDIGHWKKRRLSIVAPEFDLETPKRRLISEIENDPDKLTRLRQIVGEIWLERERKITLNRRAKYGNPTEIQS